MGGCVSTSKELKAELDAAKAPEPVPEVVKEETSIVSEPKKIDGGESKEIGEVKTSNDGEVEVDEKGNRRKSLNSLLMENVEVKELDENEKATQIETIPSEAAKEVEVPKTEISTKSSNTSAIKTASVVQTVKAEISEENKAVEAKVEPAKDVKVIEKEASIVQVASAVEVKEEAEVTK